MPLRIYLAGRITMECEGTFIAQDAFPGKQGVLAFARLVVDRGQAVSHDALANLLWPDKLPRAWDAALHAIMSKLRVLLATAGLEKSQSLVSAASCYQLLLPSDAWVDIEAAAAAIHEAEGLLKADLWKPAWAAAQVAYHITRRPFLTGEAGDWVTQQREHLSAIFVRAGECLAETYIRNGEATVAIELAQEVLATQAYRETGYQLLMRAHAGAGNRAQALRVYERCRQLISQELGVAPSKETQAVYLTILQSR